MKKKMFTLIILFCFVFMLKYPSNATNAAKNGLLLWFWQIIPTLLPFTILSNILMASNLLFPISDAGLFVLLSGFLFGFPIGSKNCAHLLREKKLPYEEAKVLFILANHMSPVFLQSYVLDQQLHLTQYTCVSYVILYIPSILLAFYLTKNRTKNNKLHKNTASRSKIDFQIIDAGIMNGFETLTQIGGYIIIFSMLASMIELLPLPNHFKVICVGLMELTNGIQALCESNLPISYKYILAMTFTSFGGMSGIMQTNSMIKNTELSIRNYCIMKCFLALLTGLFAYFFIQINPMRYQF